jgi:hypothetical protein
MNMGGAGGGRASMSNTAAPLSNNNMSNNNNNNNTDMMSMMKNDQPNSKKIVSSGNNSNVHSTIVNVSDYQSAMGLINKAQEIFNNVLKQSKAPSDKASTIAEVESGLTQLKSAIDAKKPYSDVMLIIHTKVHPSIMDAFNLKLS